LSDKHKIAGGILPLETAAIEPAWEALNLTPEEYLEYLNDLPFGHKYLLERSTLTAPPPPSASPEPQSGKSGKTPRRQRKNSYLTSRNKHSSNS
jgi:hypothetical protein